tara:strand:- start:313 stop:549 length:237 start_codon:yes stop_codon:yes gene_type:complete
MYRKTRVGDVVKASPSQLFVIHIKAQWFDDMEHTASVRTQSKNIACVGRYLGMNQNDVKHRLLPFSLYSALFHHCLSP